MVLNTTLKRLIAMVALSSATIVCFADDAPVYEVDNYPPSFEAQQEAQQFEPVPPAHVQQQNNQVVYEAPTYSPPPMPSLSTDQRIARLEQQLNNLQNSSSTALTENLQKEVQALRGQVEELTHQLQVVQNQQRTLFSDTEKRLANNAGVTSTPANEMITDPSQKNNTATTTKGAANKPANKAVTVSTAKPVEQPNVAEEQQIYQTAYDLIKTKKYTEAISALQKMLQKYPSGQFAANAHYWLGELYGLVNKNDQSAMEFSTVVKQYPDSPKVSDAQLKLGLIYVSQYKWADAKTTFKKIVTKYPGTSTARLASEQLKQIKQAGH